MYARTVGGEELTFGVSGMLWRDNLVMYDRQTESWWAQAEGRAIHGPKRGARLEQVPSDMMSWKQWRTLHPRTRVLFTGASGAVRDTYASYHRGRQWAAAALPQQAPLIVPDWMAWKAFHDSLAFYSGASVASVDRMLARRFSLGIEGSAALRAAGRTYSEAIDAIDVAARAEIDRRWGLDLPRATNGQSPPVRAVKLEPGKTLLQMARESGLYDQVEEQKATALTAHLAGLDQALGGAARTSIEQWVRTSIAPRISRSDRGTPIGDIRQALPADSHTDGLQSFRR